MVSSSSPHDEVTPEMVERAVAFVRAFYPAEWGGKAGIAEVEARTLAAGLLRAVLAADRAELDPPSSS